MIKIDVLKRDYTPEEYTQLSEHFLKLLSTDEAVKKLGDLAVAHFRSLGIYSYLP